MDFTIDTLFDILNTGVAIGVLVLFIRDKIISTSRMDKIIEQLQENSLLVAKTVGEEIAKGLNQQNSNK